MQLLLKGNILQDLREGPLLKQTSNPYKVVVSEAPSTKCMFYKYLSIRTPDSNYTPDISRLSKDYMA